MKGASPQVIRSCPMVMERISKVREFRLASKKPATRAKSETPTLFDEIREPVTDYVALPKVSSENRKYIPIDYLKQEVIPGDKLFVLSGSTLYHFGVLNSFVHMAWMRAVCGRLEMRYSYSNTIVYNNFPWPEVEEFSRVEGESVENVANVQMLPIAKSNCQLGNGERGTGNGELGIENWSEWLRLPIF